MSTYQAFTKSSKTVVYGSRENEGRDKECINKKKDRGREKKEPRREARTLSISAKSTEDTSKDIVKSIQEATRTLM